MLLKNPGLKDLCHSITGGALLAQGMLQSCSFYKLTSKGYWIPYDAAKAVSATFAWDIKEALTPVFGTDFPSLCIPINAPNWAHMKVSSEIIRHCVQQAAISLNEQKLKQEEKQKLPFGRSLSSGQRVDQHQRIRSNSSMLLAVKFG